MPTAIQAFTIQRRVAPTPRWLRLADQCRSSHPRPQPLAQLLGHCPQRQAPLLRRVPVADGHRLVLERLAVDGDAPRRPGLVLTAVAPAPRPPAPIKTPQFPFLLPGQ